MPSNRDAPEPLYASPTLLDVAIRAADALETQADAALLSALKVYRDHIDHGAVVDVALRPDVVMADAAITALGRRLTVRAAALVSTGDDVDVPDNDGRRARKEGAR